jgi:hypothetical protein
MMREKEQLQKCGFEGFKTVSELMNSCKDIPKEMGVYVVLREKNETKQVKLVSLEEAQKNKLNLFD